MTKLAEMELMSKQAADRVKSILYDTHSPFKEIEWWKTKVNKKDKSWQEDALALIAYYGLHYGHNLKNLGSVVMAGSSFIAPNIIAGTILLTVGKVLEKLGKHYHLKQYKIG